MATSLKRSKGSQSSLRIGTYSFWIRFTTIGSFQVYSNTVENDNNRGYWQLTSDMKWRMVDNDASGTHIQLRTTRKFRDLSSWYHFVVRVDTTQATSTDRVRLYVNGVQETSFDQTDYPSQNTDLKIFEGGQTNREYMNNIYGGSAGSPTYYISHFHYTDGQSYGPDTFGSTDAATGEWSIKASPTVTYGNQGFFMFKNDASLNDDSGRGNNWTADSGTIQFAHDNPSNLFSTINGLAGNPLGLSTGALKAVQSNGATSSYNPVYFSSLGYTAGKFYWETKVSTFSTGSGHSVSLLRTNTGHIPTYANDNTESGTSVGNNTINYFFGENTTYFKKYGTNEQSGSVGSTLSSGDIVGMSHDVSAGEVKYFVNGSQIGSTINGVSSANDGYFYIPYWNFESKPSSRYCTMEWNMGNGYFGTTAISTNSGNGYAGAEGASKFNYQPASGFCALSTKGLNT